MTETDQIKKNFIIFLVGFFSCVYYYISAFFNITILPYLMEQMERFSQKLRLRIHLLERLATQQTKCLSNLKIKIPNNNLWANAINLLTPNKLLQRPAGERNKPTPSMWMSCKAHPNLQVMFSHRLPQL